MTEKKRKRDSTKRFGPRYGRHLKEKVAEIEKGYKGRHKCPYCNKKGAKRAAIGIWFCKLCKTKFTGRAYSIGKKRIIKEKQVQDEKTEKSKTSKSNDKEGKK